MGLAVCYKVSGPNIIHEAFEDEVILLNMNNGNYYSLAEVGADVWNLIQAGLTTTDILVAIGKRYDGDIPEIASTVNQFITQLQQENLIVEENQESLDNQQGIDALGAIKPEAVRRPFQAPTLQKFSDMREMLLLDPIHEVDETGWPGVRQEPPNK